MLDAANWLFPLILLRNSGKHQRKDQIKDCKKIQNILHQKYQ